MKTPLKTQILVLVLFLLLTLLHLFPLPFHAVDTLRDTGDPLLNTWILSTVQKNLVTQPGQLFEGNIFYPSEKTISYSEHLFPQAVVSLPISFLFKNPILTYNILFILSYVLAAYAMFMLLKYFTQNTLAGIVAGTVFAFSTFHLDHISQLQLLSSGLFVLSFLYLLRFFEEKKTKHSVLFSLFFALQTLSCIYYGLFFISILVVIVPILILFHLREIDRSFLLRLVLPAIGAGCVLLVFSLPYISLLKYSGFSRGLGSGADLGNYLGASKSNILYGKLLSPFGAAERYFFPGFLALFLAGFFIYFNRRTFHNLHRLLRIFLYVVFSTSFVAIAAILIFGGVDLNLGLFRISANDLLKPVSILSLGILFFFFLSFFLFLFKRDEDRSIETRRFYLILVFFFWALVLSFGKTFSFLGNAAEGLSLPFTWLHQHVPGFGGIRAVSRYGVFVIFTIAVMAGLGFKLLIDRLKGRGAVAFTLVLTLLALNAEYLSIPQQMRFVPTPKNLPPTYQWLKEQKEDFAVIEFPFFRAVGQESLYMYFSIFHRKNIANGYSGFLPPSFFYIRDVFDSFPSETCIRILRLLNLKYIIFHANFLSWSQVENIVERIGQEFSDDLDTIKGFEYLPQKPFEHSDKFGDDLIMRILPDTEEEVEIPELEWSELPVEGWKIQANVNDHRLPLLRDGNLETRWSTGIPKRSGETLQIELENPADHIKISNRLGSSVNDYAIDLLIEASADGERWQEIKGGYSLSEFLDSLFQSPGNLRQTIYIHGTDIKYVKWTQIGKSARFFWSIAELTVSTSK